MAKPSRSRSGIEPGVKRRGAEKFRAQPLRVVDMKARPAKPDWLRVRLPLSPRVGAVKNILRRHKLASVCEEAQCPNLGECFSNGTATFMILGEICTRRCSFCDVAHGIPLPPDADEPRHLARAVAEMGLRYVVITSVDRDDLPDGGGAHFAACIRALRAAAPDLRIEILTPDFRNRMDPALAHIFAAPPDVFNHNLETVPRLYREVRPGARYDNSLTLLRRVSGELPGVPTKSGLMLGLGETNEEVLRVLADMREHGIQSLTLGQYLQPTAYHAPVARFVPPGEFDWFRRRALEMGFSQVASGPLVRSSYHADLQAANQFHRAN